MESTKTKPAHEIRLGSVKATIWRNATAQGDRYNVILRRLYTVENEGRTEWRISDSLGLKDLALAAKVLDQAHTWIYQQRAA